MHPGNDSGKKGVIVMACKFNSEQLCIKKLFCMMNINRDIFFKYSFTECAYRRKQTCTGIWGIVLMNRA